MAEIDNTIRRPIYMDHHATTPVDPRVVEAMLPYFTEVYGNAASIDHEYGAEANRAVDAARQQIGKLINARPEEIIFTSGATESDNLAIIGVAEQYASRGNHIVTCVTEHKAVLDTCKHLERRGWKVTYLPVDSQGMLDPDDVKHAITSDTVLISVMTANNEIGVIAPVAEIGRIAREHEVLFHTDAAQAVGHISVDVEEMNIDLMSMSAHKVYGPKGVGALYVRRLKPRVRLTEQVHGGGHERGMRSGTLNVPGIVGLGEAFEIARTEMTTDSVRIGTLRDKLWLGLQEQIAHVYLNGHSIRRLAHNLNVAFPGVEGRSVTMYLKTKLAVSTGSACTSAKVEPSHVITALGFSENRAHQSVRFGLGRTNSSEQIALAIEEVSQCVRVLQRINV